MATETGDTLSIQNLQNQTIELLEQCKRTIQNVNQVLNKHQKQSGDTNNTETDSSVSGAAESVISTGSKENASTRSEPDAYSLDSIIKVLDLEIKAVKNIQLRMAIVGTMKAGKSTVMNATIGCDLLPSRNAAMTTLPTEIIFKRDVTERQLALSDDLINTLNKVCEAIRGTIVKYRTEATNDDTLSQRLGNQTHLMPAIDRIINYDTHFPAQIKNEDEIRTSLTFINDIIRISNLLEIDHDLTENNILPRLEVPAIVIDKSNDNHTYDGELILVDTPGPNEATQSNHLKEVVANELQKAALILIVLDFTSLNSDAEAQIKHEIETIRAISRDSNNINTNNQLYALITKVDNREEDKDMTSTQTIDYVASTFGIAKSNIHEISGKHALISKAFLDEFESKYGENTDSSNII